MAVFPTYTGNGGWLPILTILHNWDLSQNAQPYSAAVRCMHFEFRVFQVSVLTIVLLCQF